MLKLVRTHQFKRDLTKMKRRGKNLNKLQGVLALLVEKQSLPAKYRNHKLTGNYNNHWECHIEPDWLFVYRKTATELIMERTGTHADLFNKQPPAT